MSTSFYPLGMQSYNNNVPQGGYVSWKGSGSSSNPVGFASTNIRPLTNNDPGNVFSTGFGLPRPIKHYRKGRVIPGPDLTQYGNNPFVPQIPLINYNMNRYVKSSKGASLGGGAGGSGLLNQLMDTPGMYSVKRNSDNENNNVQELTSDCNNCQGIAVITDNYPNPNYTTNNPNQSTTTQPLCCNQESKALKRVLAPKTIISKNYFTTTKQYLQNRCQTFQQRSFNFQTNDTPSPTNEENKPGSATALNNAYYANCYPTTSYPNTNSNGCKLVYYKPSNPQFATQGAVSDRTRLLKLNVDTINTNLASLNKTDVFTSQAVTELTTGIIPSMIPVILKNKTPYCNPGLYTKTGNKTICPLSV